MRRWMRPLAAVLAVAAALAARADFGWTLWRVEAVDEAAAQRLADSGLIIANCHLRVGPNEVIVGPDDVRTLHGLRLPATVVGPIPGPTPPAVTREANDHRTGYFRLDPILAFYENLRAGSGGMVTRTRIGASIQNRDLWLYRFEAPRAPGRAAPRMFVMTFGIHAREWISPSVGMHIAERVRTLSRTSRRHQLALSRVGVAIVPVLNPDGYEFTWTDNRYWRKNRRRITSTTYGVDLNRNFATGWGGSGSSGTASSDIYRGTAAFSEPETRAVRDVIAGLPPLSAFIDFHSYGDYVLWPWGYTSQLCPHHAEHAASGQRMGNAILGATGRNYTLGPTSQVLYLASGGSNDWAYDVHDALSYVIELRGGGTGLAGFVLPESLISPTQDEAWAAFERLWFDAAGIP